MSGYLQNPEYIYMTLQLSFEGQNVNNSFLGQFPNCCNIPTSVVPLFTKKPKNYQGLCINLGFLTFCKISN